MTPLLLAPHRKLLLQAPLLTPVLLGFEGQDLTALALRVDHLQPFRQNGGPITVKLAAWKATRGMWVVAVAFRVANDSRRPLEGATHLNPQQATDLTPNKPQIAACCDISPCKTASP
jgi:hypothetical protein